MKWFICDPINAKIESSFRSTDNIWIKYPANITLKKSCRYHLNIRDKR